MSTEPTPQSTLTATNAAGQPGPVTRFSNLALPLAAAGSVLLIASAFLSWSFVPSILEDLSLYGNPAPLQIFAILMAVGVLALLAIRGRTLLWVDTTRALQVLGAGAVGYILLIILSITVEAGGLVNVDPGGWVALVGSLVVTAGAFLTPAVKPEDPLHVRYQPWVEILVMIALLAISLFAAAYALGRSDAGAFVAFLALLATLATALVRGGFFGWLTMASTRHRQVLMLGALVVAFLFPFTQNGSDTNMSIATQVLIFAAAALGLNIVVGLAGLLDLGYIAFLGSGAYVGAMMSTALTATIGWKPPFLVVVLIGACVSATLGLIIGTPTLRVSGDYLAIVTLAFGEIFRITVNNLDGSNGPDLTHGPNGIPGIPELTFFGFDFGKPHMMFGIEIGRFANYYFLLLVLIVVIITVFSRLNNSRIGRGWVAIREDERAAEAMGVNVFGLKIFAFASGAFLAGMAGTIKAHQDTAVSPDQYIFLESAFLVAAIVLGGMGTVGGVLVGATILKLLPEKLRDANKYRLLSFGILLVMMMRFRPEGLVPSRRRQLEFHEKDEHLADVVEEHHIDTEEARP